MGNTESSSASGVTDKGNGPETKATSMLSQYFSSAGSTTAKHSGGKSKQTKDEKIQSLLENEIRSREADIKMLRIRANHNRQMMMTDLKNGNKKNAYQYHKTVQSIELQISKIQSCIGKLNKELNAIYEHAMHARTMDLMKQTSRHFVNSSVSSGSLENAIAYADALADAHASVEEVGDALNYDGTSGAAEDDAEWLKILESVENDTEKVKSKPEPEQPVPQTAPAYTPLPAINTPNVPTTPLQQPEKRSNLQAIATELATKQQSYEPMKL